MHVFIKTFPNLSCRWFPPLEIVFPHHGKTPCPLLTPFSFQSAADRQSSQLQCSSRLLKTTWPVTYDLTDLIIAIFFCTTTLLQINVSSLAASLPFCKAFVITRGFVKHFKKEKAWAWILERGGSLSQNVCKKWKYYAEHLIFWYQLKIDCLCHFIHQCMQIF